MAPQSGTGVRRIRSSGRKKKTPSRGSRAKVGYPRARPKVVRDVSCVCPNCGMVIAHPQAGPCNEQRCPRCGAKMVRG